MTGQVYAPLLACPCPCPSLSLSPFLSPSLFPGSSPFGHAVANPVALANGLPFFCVVDTPPPLLVRAPAASLHVHPRCALVVSGIPPFAHPCVSSPCLPLLALAGFPLVPCSVAPLPPTSLPVAPKCLHSSCSSPSHLAHPFPFAFPFLCLVPTPLLFYNSSSCSTLSCSLPRLPVSSSRPFSPLLSALRTLALAPIASFPFVALSPPFPPLHPHPFPLHRRLHWPCSLLHFGCCRRHLRPHHRHRHPNHPHLRHRCHCSRCYLHCRCRCSVHHHCC